MKMLDALKLWTLLFSVILVAVGVICFFAFPDRMEQFQQLVGALVPVYGFAQGSALLGKPITEGVRSIIGKRIPPVDGSQGVPQ